MENKKMFEVIKSAKCNTKEVIETISTELGKSKHISLRDACTCTGNCLAKP